MLGLKEGVSAGVVKGIFSDVRLEVQRTRIK